MTRLLQTIVDGIAAGSLYAMIALGYTMVYGVLQFINFAHGDVVTVGAWVSVLMIGAFGWANLSPAAAPWAAVAIMLAAMILCGLLGFTIERLAYRPLRRAPRLNVLITAIGVSLLLQNVGQLPKVFGTEPRAMPAMFPETTLFTLGGVNIILLDVLIVVITQLLMIGLDLLVHRTKLGLGMRAVSFDANTAALMGVPVDRVISMTFVIGSSLAAAGGFLFAAKYRTLQQPADMSWILLGLKAFVAAVVGGIGNIRGAMLGGILIGLLEMLGASYLSPNLRDVYVFAVLILVLLVKPTGILGRAVKEKV